MYICELIMRGPLTGGPQKNPYERRSSAGWLAGAHDRDV